MIDAERLPCSPEKPVGLMVGRYPGLSHTRATIGQNLEGIHSSCCCRQNLCVTSSV